jgi:pSer/pThr/pTyr-binding forkhead associated (FHA) protein
MARDMHRNRMPHVACGKWESAMSSAQIKIAVVNGPLKGLSRSFREPSHCVIGRAEDCDLALSLAKDPFFANVSRHHCEIEIDPPTVHVRDLGSRNGTWLNGQKLRHGGVYLEDEADRQPGEYVPLGDGDVLDIGHNRLRVSVVKTREGSEAEMASVENV